MPKSIPHPDIKDAKVLSAMELNSIRFTGKHTLLTPEVLTSIAASANKRADVTGKQSAVTSVRNP